jgi:ribosomal protein S12 methylthiotransferase accessory factor
MFARPRISSAYAVTLAPPEAVYLVGERDSTALKGEVYQRLVPLLDGSRAVADLVNLVRPDISALHVHAALGRMERRGLLDDAGPAEQPLPADQDAYWSTVGQPGSVAARALADARVSVRTGTGTDPALASRLATSLRESGVGVAGPGAAEDLRVVVVDDYLDEALAQHNRAALDSGTPWLLVRPGGAESWVGPVFVPGSTGCWRCLADRLGANQPLDVLHRFRSVGDAGPVRAQLPSTTGTALMLAVTQVATRLATGSSDLDGAVVSVDHAEASTTRHVLTRRPQCSECGADVVLRTAPALPAAPQPKLATGDGGHRVERPETTLARLERQVSPITGVVSSLRRHETGSDLLHVYAANHPFGRHGADLRSILRGLEPTSAGKGRSDLQARASAVGEALERYSGLFTGAEERVSSTLADLPTAVHPEELLQVSDHQYATRESWNGAHSEYAFVPMRFDPERSIEWTPARSFVDGSVRHLPTAYCFYNYPQPADHYFCRADSNGSASGSTLEEAVLQGFLELVERDSIALWWYNRVRRPQLDLDQVDDGYLQAVRREYAARGRSLWVLDVTTDLGICSLVAVSGRTGEGPPMLIQGYGCHLDPAVALTRAVTELTQMLALVDQADGDFDGDPDNAAWYAQTSTAGLSYLLPDLAAPARRLGDLPRHDSDDVVTDVRWCAGLMARHGMDLLVVDQTRPDLGVAAAKVVVPGLRHFWSRYAPGRLYDVPVALGWLDRPLTEDRLNPMPIAS